VGNLIFRVLHSLKFINSQAKIVRNSTILFIVAVLVLVWFGSEAYVSQNICALSCYSLTGSTPLELAIYVAILPVILVIAGVRAMQKERKPPPAKDNKQGQETT
jgi:membrane protein implicated in regulation of membrane protease activity